VNPIDDIATYLASNGIGSLGGANPAQMPIFIDHMPEDVDNAIMVTALGSGMPNQYYSLYHTQAEIWVRHKSYASGYADARQIFELLNRKANLTLAGCYVYYLHPTTDVEGLGRDSNGRILHKVIVDVTYRDIIS
jgi:hypothetical protein